MEESPRGLPVLWYTQILTTLSLSRGRLSLATRLSAGGSAHIGHGINAPVDWGPTKLLQHYQEHNGEAFIPTSS